MPLLVVVWPLATSLPDLLTTLTLLGWFMWRHQTNKCETSETAYLCQVIFSLATNRSYFEFTALTVLGLLELTPQLCDRFAANTDRRTVQWKTLSPPIQFVHSAEINAASEMKHTVKGNLPVQWLVALHSNDVDIIADWETERLDYFTHACFVEERTVTCLYRWQKLEIETHWHDIDVQCLTTDKLVMLFLWWWLNVTKWNYALHPVLTGPLAHSIFTRCKRHITLWSRRSVSRRRWSCVFVRWRKLLPVASPRWRRCRRTDVCRPRDVGHVTERGCSWWGEWWRRWWRRLTGCWWRW